MTTTPNAPFRPTAPQQQPAPSFRAQQAPQFQGPHTPPWGQSPSGTGIPPYAARGHGQFAGQFPVMAPVGPPRQPWWQREGVVSKLLALTGVAVTLSGVVMMLVIAARAGILTPWVRVAAGAMLSAALIEAGSRVHLRPGGRVGGVSLSATGIAGFFCCVVAITSVYHWVPTAVGLAIAGLVAAASVWRAMQWRSQLLAVAVTVAAAVLAPVLTGGLNTELVLFLVLLQAAGIAPERIRGWAALLLVRTVPAVLGALSLVVRFANVTDGSFGDNAQHTILPVVIAALGLISMLSARRGRVESAAAALLAYLPLIVIVAQLDGDLALLVGAGSAVATVIAAVIARPLSIEQSAVVAISASTVALAGAATFTLGEWLPVILMTIALALTTVAGQLRNRVLAITSMGFGALAVVAYLAHTDVRALMIAGVAVDHLTLASFVGSLLLAVWAPLAALGLRRISGSDSSRPWLVGAGVVSLYGLTVSILAVGTATCGTAGFHTGQFGVTVTWMALGIGLLALSLRVADYAKIGILGGLTLAAAAVTKLFFFDLATLHGMTRAATFIVVGLLLLLAGSRYAQAFAHRRSQELPARSMAC